MLISFRYIYNGMLISNGCARDLEFSFEWINLLIDAIRLYKKMVFASIQSSKRFYEIQKGPLSAPWLCHNRSEHLPRIDFQIIIALVNN